MEQSKAQRKAVYDTETAVEAFPEPSEVGEQSVKQGYDVAAVPREVEDDR